MHGYRLLCFGCVQDLEERMKKLLNSPPLVEAVLGAEAEATERLVCPCSAF